MNSFTSANSTLMCHPDVYEMVKRMVALAFPSTIPALDPCIKIVKSPHVPKYPRKWVWPKDWSSRFIEYEKSDEAWAVPLGYGHWEDDTANPVVWQMRNPLYDNPFYINTVY